MLTAEVIKEIKLRIVDDLGYKYIRKLPGIMREMIKSYYQVSYEEACRLLFILYILDYLLGSYDKRGIYQWFKRKRTELGGLSPEDLLIGDWNPNDPKIQKILELARSLAQ